ncbi:MAG: hypothetical protein KAJ19_24950, partial [Gammaproteobacteria bacterium]|nr:hypothetical protein [Gammaproteobacteria bacterium]
EASCLVSVTGYYIINLMPSCTAGSALVAGIGIFNDYSSMSVIERTVPIPAETIAAAVISYDMGDGRTVKEALSSARNRWRITGSGNPYTYEVYDTDDNTVLWSAQATVTAGGEVQEIVPT